MKTFKRSPFGVYLQKKDMAVSVSDTWNMLIYGKENPAWLIISNIWCICIDELNVFKADMKEKCATFRDKN